MTWRVWFWLVSLSVLWGGSFFFAKVALGSFGPLTVVFGRVALAALALNLLNPLRRDASWRSFFTMGALNNAIPFSLIFWGQTHIASGLASILNATTPLFTVVVAHLLTDDEKVTAAKVAALLSGIAGVAVLIGPAAVAQPNDSLWGELACLGAALSYAFAGIYGRRFRAMGVKPLDAATGQVTASSLLILPIMLSVEQPWNGAAPTATGWTALAALALLSTALAYVLYFRILAAAGATNLLLVTFLIPVTSILLGAVFLQERLEPRHFAGMALVGLGLVVIDGRIGRLLHPAK
jgi:drug/metabolite transporter (DMT)-like permease